MDQQNNIPLPAPQTEPTKTNWFSGHNGLWIVLGILLLIVTGTIVILKSEHRALPVIGNQVVPNHVSVLLVSSVKSNVRVPVLILSAVAGGGCDQASDLQTRESYQDNILTIDVLGYNFNKGSFGACPAVILDSRAKIYIDSDWLKEGNTKEIIFKLDGKENRYRISHNNHKVVLTGISATNVITNKSGVNPPSTPTSLEITLYPLDVAIMFLAGSVSSEKDYTAAIKSFALSKGFAPADEVYAGLEQLGKNRIYVVIRNRPMPDSNRSEMVGELPNEPGVSAYLGNIGNEDEIY